MKQLFCKSFFVFFLVLSSTLKADLNQDLIECCRKNDLECVKKLIRQGADVNTIDMNYYSPLIIAVYKGNYDIANYLIERGADISYVDKNNKTAIDYATEQNNKELLQPFKKEKNDLAQHAVINPKDENNSQTKQHNYWVQTTDRPSASQTSITQNSPKEFDFKLVKFYGAFPNDFQGTYEDFKMDITVKNNTGTMKNSIEFEYRIIDIAQNITVWKRKETIFQSIDPNETILHTITEHRVMDFPKDIWLKSNNYRCDFKILEVK